MKKHQCPNCERHTDGYILGMSVEKRGCPQCYPERWPNNV